MVGSNAPLAVSSTPASPLAMAMPRVCCRVLTNSSSSLCERCTLITLERRARMRLGYAADAEAGERTPVRTGGELARGSRNEGPALTGDDSKGTALTEPIFLSR